MCWKPGQPVLIDLLTNKAGTFVVSPHPLRDGRDRVIGAIGIVLFDHPETTLQPSSASLRCCSATWTMPGASWQPAPPHAGRGGDGERRAKYTFASFIGSSPQRPRSSARRGVLRSRKPGAAAGRNGHGQRAAGARHPHCVSRASGPFVSVNIAAVPDTLLEAEILRRGPGAYTGADRKGRDGKFKLADGGTLFLDEIGDMPQSLQASCCGRCKRARSSRWAATSWCL